MTIISPISADLIAIALAKCINKAPPSTSVISRWTHPVVLVAIVPIVVIAVAVHTTLHY